MSFPLKVKFCLIRIYPVEMNDQKLYGLYSDNWEYYLICPDELKRSSQTIPAYKRRSLVIDPKIMSSIKHLTGRVPILKTAIGEHFKFASDYPRDAIMFLDTIWYSENLPKDTPLFRKDVYRVKLNPCV